MVVSALPSSSNYSRQPPQKLDNLMLKSRSNGRNPRFSSEGGGGGHATYLSFEQAKPLSQGHLKGMRFRHQTFEGEGFLHLPGTVDSSGLKSTLWESGYCLPEERNRSSNANREL